MKKANRILSALLCLVLLLGVLPVSALADGAEKPVLNVSRSKTATALTSDWTSQVTLSLPSAEEALATDVVFVIDKSQCGKQATDAAQQLIDDLLSQQALSSAKIKVGIVIFGGTAIVSRELLEVTDAAELQNAMASAARTGLHGSNVQSGLIEADKMLSADAEVSDNRKYVVLISDGRGYQFSKEGEYEDYAESGVSFNGLKTYGIYNETDIYAYAYGITYTIHEMYDQYYTGDYNTDGTWKKAWQGSYLTEGKYKTGTPGNSDEVQNYYEMPYGTWAQYWEHISSVVEKDNGKYDVLLTHANGDYDNQKIGKDLSKEDRAALANSLLGNDNYIKCGLDADGYDNQLMHASGTDRAVYEAYTKYASMATKYNCYPIYVGKPDAEVAKSAQDYGYQLIHAMGEISHNTGTSVSTENDPPTIPQIDNIFASIQNDILYAVGTGSKVVDTMGEKFDFGGLDTMTLTVGDDTLTGVPNGNTITFAHNGNNTAYVIVYDKATDSFTWTINENVSNFAPVKLTYTVKLVDREIAEGKHTVATNESAILTPKNSQGVEGKSLEFPVPELTYTVDSNGNPILPVVGTLPILWLNMEDHYSYIVGYPDGTVQPNGKITRAEVATIFFRLLSDDTREAFWSSTNSYSDVTADKWYNNAVSTLSRLGVISGYPDGTFRPDASITRAEFAKIAVSFCKYGSTTYSGCFSDVKASDWFSTCVETARNSNLIAGYPDGTFRPNNAITRAEACTIVNRTLGRKPAKNHMAISGRINWPDCLDTEWFYADMMEATNSHDYQMVGLVEDWNRKLPQRDWAALETEWSHAYSAPGGEVGR